MKFFETLNSAFIIAFLLIVAIEKASVDIPAHIIFPWCTQTVSISKDYVKNHQYYQGIRTTLEAITALVFLIKLLSISKF